MQKTEVKCVKETFFRFLIFLLFQDVGLNQSRRTNFLKIKLIELIFLVTSSAQIHWNLINSVHPDQRIKELIFFIQKTKQIQYPQDNLNN